MMTTLFKKVGLAVAAMLAVAGAQAAQIEDNFSNNAYDLGAAWTSTGSVVGALTPVDDYLYLNGTQSATLTFTLGAGFTYDNLSFNFDYFAYRNTNNPVASVELKDTSSSLFSANIARSTNNALANGLLLVAFNTALANPGDIIPNFGLSQNFNSGSFNGLSAGTYTLTFTGLNNRSKLAVDNLEIDYTATAIPTAVPEPESYAMMLAGLGALGFMARRRKTQE